MSVLVVGSVALDSIKTPYESGVYILGGSAVHFVNAASLLTSSRLVGVVGQDFSQEHIDFLKSKKADVEGLEKKEDGKTFHWEGYYEKDMNQAYTVKTELNVFETFDPSLPESYKKSTIVFLANIDPLLQLKVLNEIENPQFVACDTMNFWIESKKVELTEVLKKVTLAFFNDAEIRDFTGKQNILDAAQTVLDLGPQYVAIKKGENGILLVSKKEIFSAPAMILNTLKDPTGAGDSFAGGFMSYLDYKNKFDFTTLKKSAVYATLVASFNVQGLGVSGLESITFADVKKRFKDYKRLTSILKF